VESRSLDAFKSHGNVVEGHGQWAWWDGLGLILEDFSNLNDSVVRKKKRERRKREAKKKKTPRSPTCMDL